MQKHRNYNNYTVAIWVMFLSAACLFLPLAIMHCLAFGGDIPEWLIVLIYGPFFISQQVAGSGYLGKWIDFFTNDVSFFEFVAEAFPSPKTFFKAFVSKISAENIGLTIGIITAITLTIVQLARHTHIPFVSAIGDGIAVGIFLIDNMNTFGGLGNRLGRVIDFFRGKNHDETNNIFRQKNVNYALAIVAGVVIGISITAVVLGLTASTMGVFPAVLFAVSTIGIFASSCGYVGRCADFLLGERTLLHAAKDSLNPYDGKKKPTFRERCTKENILTLAGVGIGITVGAVLIGMGILTLPFFAVGSIKIVLGVTLMATMISAGGGLGNRLGHTIDKAMALSPDKSENDHKEDKVNSSNVIQQRLSIEEGAVLKPKAIRSETSTDNHSLSINAEEANESHVWTWVKKVASSVSAFSQKHVMFGAVASPESPVYVPINSGEKSCVVVSPSA